MLAFLATLRDLCRFRRGPEDMPHSPALLVALLVVCAILRVAFDMQNGFGLAASAVVVASGAAVLCALFGLLQMRDKAARFVQTATALAAVAALFDMLEFPLVSLLPLRQILQHFGERPAMSGGQTLAALAVSVLGIWQICVWVGVLRRALDTRLAAAVLAFLALAFVNMIAAAVVGAAIGLT